MKKGASMIVLDPLGVESAGTAAQASNDRLAPRLGTLSGASIAFVDNGWETLDGLFEKVGRLLGQRHDTRLVMHVESHDTISAEQLASLVAVTDAAVVGLGN